MKKISIVERTILGFTLAEVLITLTVIGVIAALTIPSLITDIQDTQYKTAWKKGYSDIAQAAGRIVLDNGGSMVGLCSTGILTDKNYCLANLFATYLGHSKICSPDITQGNCWHDANQWQYLNGTPISSFQSQSGLILNNGNLIIFKSYSSNCDSSSNNILVCAGGVIDINGFKGPNIVGKDIFSFYILDHSIIPSGTQGDWYDRFSTCIPGDTGVSNYGSSCSAKYLKQ